MLKLDDPRLSSLIVEFENLLTAKQEQIRVAIIGYSVDEGVARNGGRVGAKLGPEIIRAMLRKKGCVMNEEYGISLSDVQLVDMGDTVYDGDLKSTHKSHQGLVAAAIAAGCLPVIVGGGNDQSYPNFRALSSSLDESCKKIVIVNVDAHLDVRPLLSGEEPHSGSPFRQVLSDNSTQKVRLVEWASQGNQCARDHVAFVRDNGGEVVWLSELQGSLCDDDLEIPPSVTRKFADMLKRETDHSTALFLSFDVDSIRSSDCPGVSCPSTLGLTARDALEICFRAGRCPAVRMLDISEFNPAIESYRTAVLVVDMIYHFLLGLASRTSAS